MTLFAITNSSSLLPKAKALFKSISFHRFTWKGILPLMGRCYNLPMKAHVWVMPKRTVLDPQGQTIQHALSGLGYNAVKDVRQGKFFVINLDGLTREDAQSQTERISKEVLTNPVIEEFRFEIVD